MIKVLFILKKRDQAWGDKNPYSYGGFSSGLYNSATFVKDMLLKNSIEAKLVEVVDNDSIDREVTLFKPNYVIVEAIWVVPSKFEVLTNLHPSVKWIIRNHSDFPFLANEGIVVDWMLRYLNYPTVFISNNLKETNDIFIKLAGRPFTRDFSNKIIYLPNYYPVNFNVPAKKFEKKDWIDIGCFGAVRPLKNVLNQAVAAIEFGKQINKKIHFHINGGRIENGGEPVLKSIRTLFRHHGQNTLIEHEWMSHDHFLVVCGKMDIGMQVSYSETFNICAADMVQMNTPIVVSKEIRWAANIFKADINISSIIDKLKFVWRFKNFPFLNSNRKKLAKYSQKSEKVWLDFLKK